MKKIMFVFAFVIFALSMNAQNNAIKTGPIALAFGSINAAFEHQFAEKMSFLIKGSYLTGFKVGDEKVDGFSVGAGFRYYFKPNKTLAGFYIQPQARYNSAKFISVAAMLGYQFRWDGGLVLDLGIGPTKYFAASDYSGTLPGIWPSLTFAVGYAF